ncbi:hypothetical protein GCM10029992_32330 [Glycomyces albus]
MAAPAPAAAASGRPSGGTAAPMARTAATLAPPVTPTTSGDARGLRMRPCRSVPEAPSAAPTISAVTTLGRRSCWTMNTWPDSPRPNAAAPTRGIGSSLDPSVSAQAAPRAASDTRAATVTVPRARRRAKAAVAGPVLTAVMR